MRIRGAGQILLIALLFGAVGRSGRAEDEKPAIRDRGVRLRVGLRHWDGVRSAVRCVAFTPDGKTLASSSAKVVCLWSRETGGLLRTITEKEGWLAGIAFPPDGRAIVLAGEREAARAPGSTGLPFSEGIVRVWPLEDGKEPRTFTVPEAVSCLALSPDGKLAALGLSERSPAPPAAERDRPAVVRVLDLETGKELFSLSGTRRGASGLAFSPDGKRVAAALHQEGAVRVWSLGDGKLFQTFAEGLDGIASIAWDPRGERIAAGSFDGTVSLWDVNTGAKGRVLDWPARTGDLKVPIRSVAFSPDGKNIACGRMETPLDSDGAALWSVETGERLRAFPGLGETTFSVAFSPDGTALAAGESDGEVRLWRLPDGAEETWGQKGHTGRLTGAAVSRDGRTLATASRDGTVKLWDLETGAPTRSIALEARGRLKCLAFGVDGALLGCFAGGDAEREAMGTVNVVSLPDGKEAASISGLRDVSTLALSPDGKTLASGGQDRVVKLRSMESGKELLAFTGHAENTALAHLFGEALGGAANIALSADGKTAASSAWSTVKLWSTETGKETQSLSGHRHWVTGLALSPDGETLASSGHDGRVVLWELKTGKPRHAWQFPGTLRVLGFGPAGSVVAIDGDDGCSILRIPEAGKGGAPSIEQAKAEPPSGARAFRDGRLGVAVIASGEMATMPIRLVQDGDHDYLIVQYTGVLAVTDEGKVSVLAEGSPLQRAIAVIRDRTSRDLMVIDSDAHAIFRISAGGTVRPLVEDYELGGMEDIIQDTESDDFIVTDRVHQGVHRVSPRGEVKTIIASPLLNEIRGIVRDRSTKDYVVCAARNLWRIRPGGAPSPVIAPNRKNPFVFPNGVVRDEVSGDFLVTEEQGLHAGIYRVSRQGSAVRLCALPLKPIGICQERLTKDILAVTSVGFDALVRVLGAAFPSEAELECWPGVCGPQFFPD